MTSILADLPLPVPATFELPLTPKEAARVAGLSEAQFWKSVGAGRLPHPMYASPRNPRWYASEIRAALLAQRMHPREAVEQRRVARLAAEASPVVRRKYVKRPKIEADR